MKCEPTEISFIRAFHVIRYELHWAAVTRAYGKLPALMQRLRQRLVMLLNAERPGRKLDQAGLGLQSSRQAAHKPKLGVAFQQVVDQLFPS